MSAARQLDEMGVVVEVRNGKLKLGGLDTLKADEARKALDLARRNKAALVAELSALPAACRAKRDMTGLMARHPHLAPCPVRNRAWVYRGQVCSACGRKVVCSAWPEGMSFEETLPPGIPELKRGSRCEIIKRML